jgi:Polyketide cyclase / dehydrase and lipid transport
VTTIIQDVTIDADPATAWDALKDFGALNERLARGFVTECQMVTGDTRRITFFNGAVAREQLIGIDDDARRLAYSIIESSLAMTHHNASAQIADDGTGRTRFIWTVDVLPDEAAAPINLMMTAGLEAVKKTLGGDRAVA